MTGNKEEKKKISDEKTKYIENISQKRFTKEQLEKLEEIQKRKDELEPIVDEYMEKKAELEEKKFNEGRVTLEDGTIVNQREAVIGEKECNGLKFSNIELKYIPEEKCSKFSAIVSNISNEVKEGRVSVKITGDVETIFPLNIERLEPGENYSFEINNYNDISMAGKLEIVEYNKNDYE